MKYLIILFVSIICIGVGVKFVSSNYKTKLLIDNEKKIKYYFWGMVLSICGVASFFGYLRECQENCVSSFNKSNIY